MAEDNKAFYNPKDFGVWDLSTSQINKNIVFEFDSAVILQSKVVIIRESTIIKEYTIGEGLEVSEDNLTITLKIQGQDFRDCGGEELRGHCNFFVEGDTEVLITLNIIKSYV
jgi:hypothetical protein